jgi:hypothetical protein
MLFTMNLVATVALIASALANPLPSTEVSRMLSKRGEGIHLVNCDDTYSVVDVSELSILPYIARAKLIPNIQYCPDDSNCDHNPFTGDGCIPNGGGIDHWEGSTQSCTFPTGTTFVWTIASNAQSDADYSVVG